jgi:predicted Zn-dependent protease with MMP-like domain
MKRREDAATDLIDRLIDSLPPELRSAAREVPVCLESLPSQELVADGIAQDILGLFVGAPRHEHLQDPGPPPQIFLFLENIQDECLEVGSTFAEEIRRTYLHELGHYLGLDEGALADRDLD